MTAADISARIGCSPITILRRLRQFGIPARPRGPLHQAKTLNGDINWSTNLAWAVGLIATDGNLSGDGRHMAGTSIDRDVLETLRACLNLSVAITPHYGGHGHRGLRVQWVIVISMTGSSTSASHRQRALRSAPSRYPTQCLRISSEGASTGTGRLRC